MKGATHTDSNSSGFITRTVRSFPGTGVHQPGAEDQPWGAGPAGARGEKSGCSPTPWRRRDLYQSSWNPNLLKRPCRMSVGTGQLKVAGLARVAAGPAIEKLVLFCNTGLGL